MVAVLKGMGKSETEARAAAVSADGSISRALEASTGELVEARDVARRVLSRPLPPPIRGSGSRGQGSSREHWKGKRGGSEPGRDHLRAMASLVRDVELLSTRADASARQRQTSVPRSNVCTGVSRRSGHPLAFATIDQALEAIAGNAGVKVVADWVMVNL